MILSAQSIMARCSGPRPLISPFNPKRVVVNGKSAGLSSASYDCTIDHDLVLGVNPAHIIAAHVMQYGFSENAASILQDALRANPPMQALAFTAEDFHFPPDLSGAVCDKSSYARVFVSAFNTFFDPGFWGNATLELVNLGDKPVTFRKGDPVCQFLFTQLDAPTVSPYQSKYQGQTKAAHTARHENADGSFTVAVS